MTYDVEDSIGFGAEVMYEKHIRDHWNNDGADEVFLNSIWEASTEILNGLEVQVVIDSNHDLHISYGSPSYVDFQINPVGMKLPILCWIHTHPFGQAYFSGVDWRTVNTWRPLMQTAIVLGNNQYGFWHQDNPMVLEIHKVIKQLNPIFRGEEE